MANTVRVKVNTEAIGHLLRSQELASDLDRRMARVASVARGADFGEDAVVEQSSVMHDRVVARVTVTGPRALWLESKHGALARALDAAGGA